MRIPSLLRGSFARQQKVAGVLSAHEAMKEPEVLRTSERERVRETESRESVQGRGIQRLVPWCFST